VTACAGGLDSPHDNSSADHSYESPGGEHLTGVQSGGGYPPPPLALFLPLPSSSPSLSPPRRLPEGAFSLVVAALPDAVGRIRCSRAHLAQRGASSTARRI